MVGCRSNTTYTSASCSSYSGLQDGANVKTVSESPGSLRRKEHRLDASPETSSTVDIVGLRLDMFPSFFNDCGVSNTWRNFKLIRYFYCGIKALRIYFSHLNYFFFCQFRLAMRFTFKFFKSIGTSFFSRIFIIVQSCSKPKMVRVYTISNITFVKYAHSIWNFTFIYHPGNTMSLLCASISKANNTIPKWSYICIP